MYTALQNSDPSYATREQAHEAAYQEAVTTQKKGAGSGVLTLPVVVHIIHDNGPENISDAQVLKGIALLNDAFRNRNYFNPATGVDTEIEFCLAQRDLAGNAFNRIARYQSALTDMSLNLGRPASVTQWDTKNYINIILVSEACLFGNCSNVAGYATLPGTHGEPNEGIVMEARYFGTSAEDATVIVHEMGHYLGLFHTFQGGCPDGNCLKDGDRVCDTPPDNSSGFFPCEAKINSCTTDADDPSVQNPFRSPALGGLGDQSDQYRQPALGADKDGAGQVLFTSDASVDSFDLGSLPYVQLCLIAKNDHCEHASCTYTKLIADGIEICNNGLDDDNDNLIDRFDPDCVCDSTYYQAYCPLDCEYVPNPDPKIVLKLKWRSEIISDQLSFGPNVVCGDIDGDGDTEVPANCSPAVVLAKVVIKAAGQF